MPASKQNKDTERDEGKEKRWGVGGILNGFTNLVERLSELAEKGGELARNGEIQGMGSPNELKGVYGFKMKVGLGNRDIKVEPVEETRKDQTMREAVVEEIREPMVDIFEERDYTLVVAEMPGISTQDVHLEVKDDLLTLSGENGEKKYRKEILLPGTFLREKMSVSCNNGIVEIRCSK